MFLHPENAGNVFFIGDLIIFLKTWVQCLSSGNYPVTCKSRIFLIPGNNVPAREFIFVLLLRLPNGLSPGICHNLFMTLRETN